jgi:hypothetical protein
VTEPPGNGHALALAAGQLMREPISKILWQSNIFECFVHPVPGADPAHGSPVAPEACDRSRAAGGWNRMGPETAASLITGANLLGGRWMIRRLRRGCVRRSWVNLGKVIVEGEDRYGEGVKCRGPASRPGEIWSRQRSPEVENKLVSGLEPMSAEGEEYRGTGAGFPRHP